jgi:peptide/nickel transport system permease protein
VVAARFIGNRLVQLIPVVFGITLVVFFLVRLIPGDPAVVMLGYKATPANIARIHRELGLDRGIVAQYGIFLGHAVRGNLGYSYFYSQSAASLVLERLGATLFLIAYSIVVTLALAIPLSLVAAKRAESHVDRGIRAALVPGLATPPYWLGTLMILFVAVKVHVFPAGGYGTGVFGHVDSLFLPALTIALGLLPLVVRALRASLIQTMHADYTDMMRAKGIPQRVINRHALRNALIPTVTILGVNTGFLIGGVVIIEQVFGLPGLGGLMLNAISTRDYPTVQAATLLFAILVVAINLLADLVNFGLDPRLRVGRV